ncbi:MAG: hypothetical protein ACPG7F_11755 [Aggregatilineales bacterium]
MNEPFKRKRKNDMPGQSRTNCARILLIPLAFFALCTVCSVIGMNLFINELSAIGDPANEFMLALRDGDFDMAFAMASPTTQSEWQSPSYLQEFVDRPEDWTFNNFSVQNDTGQVSGTVQFADETSTAIMILLRNEGGWQITNVIYGQ